MELFAQQVLSGLASGAIYASLPIALVLIYRSTDIVNFAQGEMAMFSTYVAWQLLADGAPESSRLVGIRVGWMLALGWGLAAAVGAISGVLVAPVLFLDPNMMLSVLIFAFAAATLGGFDSPGGAVLGGLIVGVSENLAGTYIDAIGTDLEVLVPMLLIVGVLLLRPQGLFGHARVERV